MTLPAPWGGILRQLVSTLLALVFSTFLVFGALYAAPGDTLRFLTGGRTVSPEAVAEYRAQFHLDDPFFERYVAWLSAAAHGNFGDSLLSRTPVSQLIGPRVATTLLLLLLASIFMIVGGVVAGTLAGLRRGRVDALISTMTNIGLAIPAFVASALLVTIFAVGLGWFPVFGDGQGLVDRIYHLILPAVALALGGGAYITRVTRVAVRAELGREHVATARSRGVPTSQIVRRHVLRNALIPVTTVAGLTVAGLVAGSVVVETAFGLDGLGSLLVSSVVAKDFSVVQAVSLLLVVGFLAVNLIVDLLYLVIDPRLRGGATR